MRIRNWLILMGLAFSFVHRIISEGITGIFTGVILISFPVILLYPLFLARVLGAGDIKLFSVIGGFVNFKELIWCILFAFFFGAALSLLKMLSARVLLSGFHRGILYIRGLCKGILKAYEPDTGPYLRIHFSIAILLGLISTQILIS